ncbi:MAG: hypothetical protein EZS28_012735 [Streblomastix strix]|uniref:Tyr recombinase domain-containing protein n=1 Tax=Streblomastix strix TaxID=222440 RepID=A0A5J4WA32_9EUKA|nr:MAG: hypothetical protein EZS28_012735 [Streblomastix strix]
MLPPGKLIASLVSGNPSQAKDYLDFALVRQNSQHKQFIVQQNLGKHNGEDTHMVSEGFQNIQLPSNQNKGLSHHAIKEARTSSSVVFDKTGIKLEQGLISSIMRKDYRESAKIQKEEAMWDLDILLNYIRRNAKKPFQTLKLRKGRNLSPLDQGRRVLSCFLVKNLEQVQPQVYQQYLMYLGSATREDCSLKIRQLLFESGIPKPARVTDIRAAALTKLISSGATKEEADRWLRHSQSVETVRRYYDRNNKQSAREAIAGSFKEVSLLGGKLPRRRGSVQSHQWI